MATDIPFYRYATEFPDAIPALLGLEHRTTWRARSLVQKKEHRIDAVLLPSDPAAPRVLVEFQAYRDDAILQRIIAGAGLYCEQERFTGTLHLAVIFTDPAFARQLEPVCWSLEGSRVVRLMPQCVILGPEVARSLLESGDVEQIPLLPLCVRSEGEVRAEAAGWRSRIDASNLTLQEKSSLTSLLGAFIVHRIGQLGLRALNTLLGGFHMENTQVGRELIQIGRVQGLEEGLEKGLEKGLVALRSVILQVLVKRFKTIPRSVHMLLHRIDDPDIVGPLATLALDSESLEAFESALREMVGD